MKIIKKKNYKSIDQWNFFRKTIEIKRVLIVFCLGWILVSCNACSPDDNPDPGGTGSGKLTETGGVTEQDFDKYPGDVGIILNTRNIAKKGYDPQSAAITISASKGSYSQTVDLDNFTFMGQIKISLKALSTDAINELGEGVPVAIDVKDASGKSIISQNLSKVIFKANPEPIALNTASLQETNDHKKVSLDQNTSYYVQKVDADGNPVTMAMRVNRAAGYGNILTTSTNNTFKGVEEEPDFIFNFVPIEGEPSTFAIKLQAFNRFISVANISVKGQTVKAPRMSNLTSFSEVQNAANFEDYKFIIEKTNDGMYAIVSKPGKQALKVSGGVGLILGNGEDIYFRIISNSLSWSAESIGTTFLPPMLAAPSTDFGANSTLTNCSSGTLSQTVGNDVSVTLTNKVGWEESFSMTGSVTTSVSATVGTEFEAGFFGTSATYNASVTASLEASVSMTSGSSKFQESEASKSETIFFQREITVPPGKATLVYDIAQIYSNTKVQFVQRFRLRAAASDKALSGEELSSQLQFSRFNGVVTQIGSDYIDISIKGTATLGKVLRTRSEAQDVQAACNK